MQVGSRRKQHGIARLGLGGEQICVNVNAWSALRCVLLVHVYRLSDFGGETQVSAINGSLWRQDVSADNITACTLLTVTHSHELICFQVYSRLCRDKSDEWQTGDCKQVDQRILPQNV